MRYGFSSLLTFIIHVLVAWVFVSCDGLQNSIEVKMARDAAAADCDSRGACIKDPRGLLLYNPDLVTENLVLKRQKASHGSDSELLLSATKLKRLIKGIDLVGPSDSCDSPKDVNGTNPTLSKLLQLKEGLYKACIAYVGQGLVKRVFALEFFQVDTTPPQVAGGLSHDSLTSNSVSLNWSKPGDNLTIEGKLVYTFYTSRTQPLGSLSDVKQFGNRYQSQLLGGVSFTLKNMEPNTPHYAAVVVSDEAGNESLVGSTYFQTQVSDVTEPLAVADPVLSTTSGIYYGNQAVTISSATPEAFVYYTLDGNSPTTSSTLYTGPITVSTKKTLKAIAVKAGFNSSGVVSATYTVFTKLTNPNPGEGFAGQVVELTNGNIVVSNPFDSLYGSQSGAVYLFNGSTGALISTLHGSNDGDRVGLLASGLAEGVIPLSNGNFVVVSGMIGAVTWCSGTAGCNGAVSEVNSIVGTAGLVGMGGSDVYITELSNGNYLIHSPGGNSGDGSVTFRKGDGTSPNGPISAVNSLVNVGISEIKTLANGNYIVSNPDWSCASADVSAGRCSIVASGVGHVTWGSGTTGISGYVSSSISLLGSTARDNIGSSGIVALTNGNYVVASRNWDCNSAAPQSCTTSNNDVGAVTWANGSTGRSGHVSAANSFVGSTSGDSVGYFVAALSNGNYVIASPWWDCKTSAPQNCPRAAHDAGAVTWANGATGLIGVPLYPDSLVGETTGAWVGMDNTGGMGYPGIYALTNGNYVVASTNWGCNSIAVAAGRCSSLATRAGAVTWGNGSTEGPRLTGYITTSNSLIGSRANDFVGGGDNLLDPDFYVRRARGVTVLANGNYVVSSPNWNGTTAALAMGAVTFRKGDGSSSNGIVSSSNSLVGSAAGDRIGMYGVKALVNGTRSTDGNYLVLNPSWNGNKGAITCSSGTSGLAGILSSENSLVGSKSGTLSKDDAGGDLLGWENSDDPSFNHYGMGDYPYFLGNTSFNNAITELTNGNYVLHAHNWHDSGSLAGAVTFRKGDCSDSFGTINSANSLIGSGQNLIGSALARVTALTNGGYVVLAPNTSDGSNVYLGSATWGSGVSGVSGLIDTTNSLIGNTDQDFASAAIVPLTNGNYIVTLPSYDENGAPDVGSVTWGSGTTGVVGRISLSNSIIGTSSSAVNFSKALSSGNYLVGVSDLFGFIADGSFMSNGTP